MEGGRERSACAACRYPAAPVGACARAGASPPLPLLARYVIAGARWRLADGFGLHAREIARLPDTPAPRTLADTAAAADDGPAGTPRSYVICSLVPAGVAARGPGPAHGDLARQGLLFAVIQLLDLAGGQLSKGARAGGPRVTDGGMRGSPPLPPTLVGGRGRELVTGLARPVGLGPRALSMRHLLHARHRVRRCAAVCPVDSALHARPQTSPPHRCAASPPVGLRP